MTGITRRAALGMLGAAGALVALGLAGGHLLRDSLKSMSGDGMMGSGMMGSATHADMSSYMELFDRHTELRRTVETIDGGVRTTTESDAPDLVALLQALFRNSTSYRRELTTTAKGVVVTETSSDPRIASAIRD